MLTRWLVLNTYRTVFRLARAAGVERWPLASGRRIAGLLGPIVRRMVARSVPNRPVVIRGHQMLLPRQCDLAAWFLTDNFERGTTEWLERHLREGMTVIDGGANVGYYTLLAARRVGGSGRVYAFEPQSDNYALLVKNVELNGYRNVIAVNKALGARRGTAALRLQGTSQHSLYLPTPSSGGSEPVEVVSLDEFLESEGWPTVDLVKLDLEGGEPAAIDGMRRLLGRSNTTRLILEMHLEHLKQVQMDAAAFIQGLQALGFDVAVIDDRRGGLLPLEAAPMLLAYQDEINLLCQRQEQGDAVHSPSSGHASGQRLSGIQLRS